MAATGTLYLAISCHNKSGTDLAKDVLRASADNPGQALNDIVNFLMRVAGGLESARVYAAADTPSGGTAGTATLTFTQANFTAGETFTVCGVTFTAVASESSDARTAMNQVEDQASNAATGVAVKNKINAHPLLKDLVTATDNGGGVVTCTFKDKGLFANLGVLAETGDWCVVTQPSNGAEGTLTASLRAYSKGI